MHDTADDQPVVSASAAGHFSGVGSGTHDDLLGPPGRSRWDQDHGKHLGHARRRSWQVDHCGTCWRCSGSSSGALLGLIKDPRLVVLLMALFAGASAGGVAGQLPWGDVGQFGGQIAGAGRWGRLDSLAVDGCRKDSTRKGSSSTSERASREQKGLHGIHNERQECLRCLKRGHGRGLE